MEYKMNLKSTTVNCQSLLMKLKAYECLSVRALSSDEIVIAEELVISKLISKTCSPIDTHYYYLNQDDCSDQDLIDHI